MSLEAERSELESTVAAARDTALQLRQEAAELAAVLERLDAEGEGPPDVVAEQRRLLSEIEVSLRRLRDLDRRETELRGG